MSKLNAGDKIKIHFLTNGLWIDAEIVEKDNKLKVRRTNLVFNPSHPDFGAYAYDDIESLNDKDIKYEIVSRATKSTETK